MNGKWWAQVKVEGNNMKLGGERGFNTQQDAVNA
jgi:hypothetical protein